MNCMVGEPKPVVMLEYMVRSVVKNSHAPPTEVLVEQRTSACPCLMALYQQPLAYQIPVFQQEGGREHAS